ncbi:relaxase/mobilization nuclease domain-containing protein (plasmid) [Pseudomonas aeruginosa]|uniref:relaxase/mobilization nuclease domain-containing protein n=1 Tax=Pseudomonas aeruginosa TaxID=287 RepID=UPI0018C968C8|nr:relaxase/mobilization nuclease domain-containing protein [Pseudomonas aeruginosa]QPN17977.1 relaxase/mobilization nuclease domain-containing protein [Pseudomonas aeruginosa]
MSRVVDGVLKDWGERYDYGRVQGRRGKNIRSGPPKKAPPPAKPSGPATREKVARTVKKAPEVMVKISGGGKNMQRIKAHMDYISRNGAVDLEDENGYTYLGKEDVRAVRDAWAKGKIGIPYEGEKRREAFNIVLSMPPGTDRQAVKNAARAFASAQFNNHQYVFAAHDDEKHPHVHLSVKAVDFDGVRLNPRKADLQLWRELFAEKLRDQGIEANATPRKARGVVQKAEKQAVRQMERRGAVSRAKAAQLADAEREATGGPKKKNPAQDRISANRKEAEQTYGKVARALASGETEDKQLAVQIVRFVQQMPPLETQHDVLVQRLRKQSDKGDGRGRTRGQEQTEPSKGIEKGKGSGPDRT